MYEVLQFTNSTNFKPNQEKFFVIEFWRKYFYIDLRMAALSASNIVFKNNKQFLQ